LAREFIHPLSYFFAGHCLASLIARGGEKAGPRVTVPGPAPHQPTHHSVSKKDVSLYPRRMVKDELKAKDAKPENFVDTIRARAG